MESENSPAKDQKELDAIENLEELEPLPELESAEEESVEYSRGESLVSMRKKSRRLPLLLRLTRRAVVFLSLTLIATILFFVTGNKQTFLDSNLRMILKIIAANAIALAFFSLAAIPECVFFTVKSKKLHLIFHLVCYAILLISSITVSVLSLAIHLLSEGIDF